MRIELIEKILKVELGDKFTIYEVESFRDEVLKQIENSEKIELNGSSVESCDTLGVQTLFSLSKTAKAKSIPLELNLSEELKNRSEFFGFKY
jgi:anti-anti-sigma regulatory factor